MCSPSKRRDMDIMKLMMSDFEVCMGDADSPSDFYVKFFGPKDSLYEGGIYKVHVTLPATYPYKSPSIGFCTAIFHPNVDEASGSVCLDVINQAWSPMFDLVNIFAVFLPQLLLYPNPADPLNPSAAAAMAKGLEEYKERVRNHVKKHAYVDFKLNKEEEEEEEEDDGMNGASGSGSADDEEAALSDVDDMPTDQADEPQAAGELEL